MSSAPLITAAELSGRIGVSVDTLYRYVRDKKIPYYRVGSMLRFDEAEVRDAIRGKA